MPHTVNLYTYPVVGKVTPISNSDKDLYRDPFQLIYISTLPHVTPTECKGLILISLCQMSQYARVKYTIYRIPHKTKDLQFKIWLNKKTLL